MSQRTLRAARLWIVLFFLLAAGSASAFSVEALSGTIKAHFGVNHNGDALYAVPIQVPPGTGGMQPHLTLVYESSVPDGPMGVGWRLEGLEVITRCRPTLAQDGFSGSINYSATDRFCLDGERLVAIEGAYGADGTVYHTERERRVRITSYGICGNGPCLFELIRRDGVVLELGNSADSRVLRQGSADARLWAVNSYRDPNLNTMRITYTQDQGAVYPNEIKYTENGDLTSGRRVNFIYQPRASSLPSFVQGAEVRHGLTLSEIQTHTLGGQARSYTLEYDTLSGHAVPRLERLIECANGSCLPETTFQWTEPTTTIEGYGFNSITGFDFGLEPRSFADVNGDGRADFCRLLGSGTSARLSCALASEHGFSGEFSSGTPFDFGYSDVRTFADVNGDGRADYCRNVGDSPNIFLSCALAGESGFGLYDFNSPPGFDLGRAAPYQRAFVDVDGDGRADFCRASSSDPIILTCARAGDDGFHSGELTSLPANLGFDFGYANFPRSFADVNGDGRAEYCRAVGISPNIFLSCAAFNGVGFEFYSFNSAPGFDFGIPSYPQQFTDANGDGRADYCRTVGISPNLSISCALSRGEGFGLYDMGSAPGFDFGPQPSLPRAYTDVNGDGRTDFCRFVGVAPNIFFSCAAAREDGFGLYDYSANSTTWTDPGYAYPRAFVTTAPGSGTSLCRMVGNAPHTSLSCTRLPPPQGHRIEGIVDGYGQSVRITYSHLDDRSVYTPSNDATYPLRDVRGGKRWVVSSYTRESQTQTEVGAFRYTYSYHYAGARTSLEGRGWQGFREITRRDHDLGLVTVTKLKQDFPFTGMTESDTLYCDPIYGRDAACTSFAAVHRTTNTYETRQPFSGTTEVLSLEKVSEAFEYGVPATSLRQLFDSDTYGNISREQRTSSVHGGESSELFIHRQYWNDAGRNRFGFPTEEVQSRDAAGTDVLSRVRRVFHPLTLDVLEQSHWEDTAGRWLTTTSVFDRFGNPVQVTEPGGAVHHTSYDATYGTFPEATSTRAGADRPLLTTHLSFDPRFGQETLRVEPSGTTKRTTYDGFGRVVSLEGTHPQTGLDTLLQHVSWTFNPDDAAVRESVTPLDWDGRWMTRRDTMDALGRVVLSTFVDHNGGTRLQETRYTSSRRIAARSKLHAPGTQPLFETYRYDSLQRPVESIDASSLITRYTYAAPARVIAEVAEGTAREKTRTIDYVSRNGQLKAASVLHGNGQRVDFRHDALGRLEVATDLFRGDLLRQSYDSLGRHTQTWNPQAGSVTYTYDDAGHLASRSSRGGQGTRTYTYDDLGRLVREIALDQSVSETLDFAWDDASQNALGRLASVTSDRGWSYGYTYDQAGQVGRRDMWILGRGYQIDQTFDPAGRNLTTRFPDGSLRTSTYGDAGVLASVYFMEVDGNLRRLVDIAEIQPDTRPSKITLGPIGLEMGWTAEGMLTERSAQTQAGLVDQESVLRTAGRFVDGTHDALAPAKNQTFAHDAAGQLVSALGGYAPRSFAYDDGGDLLLQGPRSFQYQDGRVVRATENGNEVFTGAYDIGGRLVDRQTPAGHDVMLYGARDRLEKVIRDDVTAAEFLYDHRGRRIYKVETGVETFYVDGDYEETVHAGGVQQTRYVRSPEGGYASISRGAAVARAGYPADGDQFFLTDHLGSVRKVFNGLGQLSTTVDYTPFGEAWNLDGPEDFRHGYAGMELDHSTGLHYDRARYYDATLGRFITPDTRLGGGMLEYPAFNRYAYGANDPAYFSDPSGHNWFSDAWNHFKENVKSAWHATKQWVKDHWQATVGIALGVVAVVGGLALGATPFGRGLLGAGISSIVYSASHTNDFSWEDWGVSVAAGAASGAVLGTETFRNMGAIPRIGTGALIHGAIFRIFHPNASPEDAAKALGIGAGGTIIGQLIPTVVGRIFPSVLEAANRSMNVGGPDHPASSTSRHLVSATDRVDHEIARIFDLRTPTGMAWAGGQL